MLKWPRLLRFVSSAENRCDAQTPCAAEVSRLTGHLLRQLPALPGNDHVQVKCLCVSH